MLWSSECKVQGKKSSHIFKKSEDKAQLGKVRPQTNTDFRVHMESRDAFFAFSRTTLAVSRGRYGLIRDFYSNLDRGGINLTKYGADDVTLSDIYKTTAHRKEDLIVRYF